MSHTSTARAIVDLDGFPLGNRILVSYAAGGALWMDARLCRVQVGPRRRIMASPHFDVRLRLSTLLVDGEAEARGLRGTRFAFNTPRAAAPAKNRGGQRAVLGATPRSRTFGNIHLVVRMLSLHGWL